MSATERKSGEMERKAAEGHRGINTHVMSHYRMHT